MINEIIRLLEDFRDILPLILTIVYSTSFFLIIISTIMNLKEFKRYFKNVKKFSWVLLLFIFLLGLLIRIYTPRYIATYYDELVSVEAARNIIEYGRLEMCQYRGYQKRDCSLYNEAGGFMFILAIFHFIFGVSEAVAVGTSVFFGSLLIFGVFFLLYILLEKDKIGLYAAFLISISPLYILLSNTIEPDTVSTFFGLASIISFLLFIKIKNFRTAFLLISLLSFFIQIKNENIIIIFPLILFLFISKTIYLFKKPKFWSLVLLLVVLILPHILHTFLEMYGSVLLKQSTATAPSGTLFNLTKIPENIWMLKDELKGIYYPFIINSFILVGILDFFNHKKEIGFLLLLFLTFSTLYLSYSAGMVEKYILICTVPLMSLAGIGLWKFEKSIDKLIKNEWILFFIIIMVITLFSLPYLYKLKNDPKPLVSHGSPRDEIFYKENEIVYSISKKIDCNCYVVTEEPLIFIFTNISPIKTEAVLEDSNVIEKILEKTNCVLYFEDLFCTDFYTFGNRCGSSSTFEGCEKERKEIVNRCQKMHKEYDLKLQMDFSFIVSENIKMQYNQQRNNINFNLYNVSLK